MKLDEVTVRQLFEKYQDGMSLVDIKKQEGVSVGRMHYYFKKYGLTCRSKKEGNKRRRLYNYDQIKEMYESGLSTETIAKKLGSTSHETIREALGRMGIKRRTRANSISASLSPSIFQQDDEIIRLYKEEDWHCAKIGKKYDVHKSVIHRLLRRHDIIPRKRSGNYIDGRTPVYKNIRNSPKYSEWREACMKRDNYKSVLSGKTGELNVHHKTPFAQLLNDLIDETGLDPIKDKQALYQKAMNYDPLWDTSNGMTLLKREHKSMHGV